jgi:hypothetical protein
MLDADLLVGELAKAGIKTTMTKSEEGILSVAG